MQGKPLRVTLRMFMKRMKLKKRKTTTTAATFFSIFFIHDIDHSVTNYNKTSWNSVPDSNVFFCSDNLSYLFLLQVKQYHQDWLCKTTKLRGFQQKISNRQLRHMTIIFETKENAWPAHTILDSIFCMKTFQCKKSARGDLGDNFECRAYIYKVKFGRCSIFWELNGTFGARIWNTGIKIQFSVYFEAKVKRQYLIRAPKVPFNFHFKI